jgi:hypothetical protein
MERGRKLPSPTKRNFKRSGEDKATMDPDFNRDIQHGSNTTVGE